MLEMLKSVFPLKQENLSLLDSIINDSVVAAKWAETFLFLMCPR